jgi:hypothetical protein
MVDSREANASSLRQRSEELRDHLERGWAYVRPGGSRARDTRYLDRFLALLRQYERVEDQLAAELEGWESEYEGEFV